LKKRKEGREESQDEAKEEEHGVGRKVLKSERV